MKKVLIVTSGVGWGETMTEELKDYEVRVSSQDDALMEFLAFEPDLTLVNEYEEAERISERWGKAVQNFRDIKVSAREGQTVLRSGFLPLPYEDFLRLPFGADILLEYLK